MTYPQSDFSILNASEKQESSNFLEKEKRLKKIYEITVKTRNFEIAQLIQRNNFFMIFQGVLLACVISSKDTVPFVQFIISSAGFYIAYCQTKVAAGAKFWQEYWESEVYKAEEQLEDLYKNNFLFEGKKINSNFQLQNFIPLFIKSKEQVYSQVSERLLKTSPTTTITSPSYIIAPPIKINRFIKLLFSGEKLKPSIFSTNKLILEKPSVSKIPIHVGQCLIITWALLMLSCLGIYNQILEWKPINDIALRGFPTHKEAIKQEIYLSNDKDKTSPLYLANNRERNTDNAISGSTIPLQVDLGSLHNLSTNNEIFLNIHIHKNENATTSYKISDSDLETKK